MEYVFGILAGLAFGGVAGVCKYLALWRNLLSSKNDKNFNMGTIYVRMTISYGINVLILLVVFLTREMVPFNFIATILAAGIGLSLAGKLSPMRKIMEHVEEK